MRPTLDQLAARVKLHKGSVSRILNGKGRGFSDETQRRVLAAATEMGYRPNGTARALATGATQMVALWLLNLESYSPFYGVIHHCLYRIGMAHGYQLITEDVRSCADEADYSRLLQWPVDGILACDVGHVLAGYAHSGARRQAPIVGLGAWYEADADFAGVDFYTGAREATQHLVSSGCRRIAFVGRKRPDERRAEAYEEVLRQAGRQAEYIPTFEDSRQAGYQSLRDYVQARGCPDGLFCFNDEIAIGCYRGLSEMGIRVPDDVLLVGFDGLEDGQFLPCPISSVVIPVEEMCTLAWDMLLKRRNDPESPWQQRKLVAHLEIRASSQR